MIYLIIAVLVLWASVSHLCLDSFNDFCGCDDEWDELPLWVQLPVMVVAPLLYVFWSR